MSRVNENDATLAVNAAAQKIFAEGRQQAYDALERSGRLDQANRLAQWEELPPLVQNQYRDAVLSTVWAALEALPDNRRTIWLEGYIAADNGRDEETCPYPG
jgi:hypothetical protein